MVVANSFANVYNNKREEDFPSLKGYNDYLEEVEDLTFNLIEGIDIAAIEAEIAKYEADNAEQIMNARACKAEELAAALATSKGPSQVDTEVATELSSQDGTDRNGSTTSPPWGRRCES